MERFAYVLLAQPLMLKNCYYIEGFTNATNNTYIQGWITIAHPWYGGHSTSINVCGVWGVKVRVQISRREFHKHIHLDYDRVEILSYK